MDLTQIIKELEGDKKIIDAFLVPLKEIYRLDKDRKNNFLISFKFFYDLS